MLCAVGVGGVGAVKVMVEGLTVARVAVACGNFCNGVDEAQMQSEWTEGW